jgi:alkylation response protein AidB-like acyl-CoA dehydrogenase
MMLLASAQAGAAMACTTMTVSHARDRLQFGLPIGSFQAVKHRCADMFIEAQLARSIADGAAADTLGRDAAHAAKAFCSDAYRRVTSTAMQLHGGMGITWEHDAHLFFRDAHATAPLLGGAAAHRGILAGRMRSTARHRSESTG